MKTFEQFLHEKLGGTLPPVPVLTEEDQKTVEKILGVRDENFLGEDFVILDLPRPADAENQMDTLIKEHYGNREVRIEAGTLDTSFLYSSDGQYTLRWSWPPDTKRLRVTVQEQMI